MREIKFRAWLPGIKKMTYPHTLDELTNWNTNLKDNGTAVWLQYTGLKDRNGKEIYEGDIIEMECGCDSEYGCKHGPWHGYVEWDKETASYQLRSMNGKWSGEAFEDDMQDEWEVIGNIYENPELLAGDSR